jgi:MFS family permease
MGVGRFAFTPLFPIMQADAGISIAGGSALASANYVGYLVGALAALSIRVDMLVAIRASLGVTAVSTLAMGLTDSHAPWIALRAISGFASAFLLVYVSAWALERVGAEPLHRAGVFSGVGMGIFVVGVACLTFNATGVGAAGSWIALGLGSCMVTALVWRAYDVPAASFHRKAVARCSPGLLDSGPRRNNVSVVVRAWRAVLAYAAAGFGYIIPATFLPAMASAHGTNSAWVDLAWPVLGLAAFASTFLAARIFPEACALRVWKWAQMGMALGVGLPALSPTLPALVTSGVCVGGTFMVITMTAMEAARDLGGLEPRQFMAVMTAAFALGQIAGPLVVAVLLGADGDFSRPLTFAALVLAAGVLVLPGATRRAVVITTKEA